VNKHPLPVEKRPTIAVNEEPPQPSDKRSTEVNNHPLPVEKHLPVVMDKHPFEPVPTRLGAVAKKQLPTVEKPAREVRAQVENQVVSAAERHKMHIERSIRDPTCVRCNQTLKDDDRKRLEAQQNMHREVQKRNADAIAGLTIPKKPRLTLTAVRSPAPPTTITPKSIVCTITSQITFRCTKDLLNLMKSKGPEDKLIELNIENKQILSALALQHLMAKMRRRIFQLRPLRDSAGAYQEGVVFLRNLYADQKGFKMISDANLNVQSVLIGLSKYEKLEDMLTLPAMKDYLTKSLKPEQTEEDRILLITLTEHKERSKPVEEATK